MVVTDDLDGMIDELREAGATFRGDVAEAGAGRQILLQDPSGNVVELFEYADHSSSVAIQPAACRRQLHDA